MVKAIKSFSFKKLSPKHISAIIVILGVVALGTYFIINSFAATPYVAVEADSGTLSGAASIVSSTTATDGHYVQFGTSSTSTGGGGGTTSSGVWSPSPTANWNWVITGTFSTTSAADMGTGVKAYNGAAADPTIFDIDGILNSASTVQAIHALGDKAICYIEVGTAGNYYSTSDEGTSSTYFAQLQAAGDLSTSELSGYPEYFININQPSAVTIMESMIKQQCSAKGFDGVETDLDETLNNNEGNTPWTISDANEEAYLTTLANYMHSLNLAWIAKNLDDTGDSSFVDTMEPLAQGMISEESNYYSTTSLWAPFEAADKWIGNAEYTDDGETTAKFCPADNAVSAGDVNGVLYNVNLDASTYEPCR